MQEVVLSGRPPRHLQSSGGTALLSLPCNADTTAGEVSESSLTIGWRSVIVMMVFSREKIDREMTKSMISKDDCRQVLDELNISNL